MPRFHLFCRFVIDFEMQTSENQLKISMSIFGCMSLGVTMVGLPAALFVGVLPFFLFCRFVIDFEMQTSGNLLIISLSILLACHLV